MFTPAAITTMAAATATMAAATATIYGNARACVCNNGTRAFSRKTPSRFAQEGLLPNVCGFFAFYRLCVACAHVCGMARCKLNNSPMKDRFE